jgi:hypothetical protein
MLRLNDPQLQAPTIWASYVGPVSAAMPDSPLQPHPLLPEDSPTSRLAASAGHLHR